MNLQPFHRTAALTILSAGMALNLPAFGQTPQPAPPGVSRTGHTAPSSPREALQSIVESLARRHKTPVLLDPALLPAFHPKAPAAGLPVEEALDSLASALPRAAWRRIYLPRSKSQQDLRGENIAAAVRALDRWAADSLSIENTAARRATTLLIDRPTTAAHKSGRKAQEFSGGPIYVLFSIDAGSVDSPEDQLTHLQRQQMAMKVGPEYLALGMVQMMQMIQSMEPAAREQLLERTGRAAMLLWEGTPPHQRQEMIQESLGLMKSFDAGLRARARDATARRPGRAEPHDRRTAPPSYLPQLQTVLHGVAARGDTTIVVDSALLVAAPPAEPDHTLPVEKALDALAAAVPDAIWRRVYLPSSPDYRVPPPEKLVAAARALDQWAHGSLVIEDTKSGRAATLLSERVVTPSFREELAGGAFSPTPLYVVYSTSASAGGRTPEERFADLQQQQMRLMTRMTVDHMVQSMRQVTERFMSTDSDSRSRLMGLPIMAGMMAVWFPREAKENGPIAPR